MPRTVRDLAKVLPRVRPRAHFAITEPARVNAGAASRVLDFEVLCEHFASCLAMVGDDGKTLVDTDATELGVDRAALHPIALANLRARTPTALQRSGKKVYSGNWGDSFAPSRLMLHELFEGLEVEGNPVVVVPTHELMFVAGSEDGPGLLTIHTMAAEAARLPNGFSQIALERVDGEWHVFDPDSSHPLARAFNTNVAREVVKLYEPGNQRVLNEGALADRLGSIALWIAGEEPAVVPRTENVALKRGDDLVLVDWPVLTRIMGPRMVCAFASSGDAFPMYPPYYGLPDPTDEEWRELTSAGLPTDRLDALFPVRPSRRPLFIAAVVVVAGLLATYMLRR